MTDSAPPLGRLPDDPPADLGKDDLAESAVGDRENVPDAGEPDLTEEVPLDAPEADVAEQRQSVRPGTAARVVRRHLPPEANEADVQEQDQIVEIDDEDER